MTIVAEEDHRNAAWAKDQSNFGQRMLVKMGWSQGKGLGKNQQGTSTNLKAIRREDGLGIGAKTDTFGDEGFGNTSRNFHGLLAALKEEHTSSDGSKKKKKKKGSKKDKKSDGKQKQKDSSASSSASEITLATNRVAAGHSRKMRESKDLSKKSKEDMAAIFGMKVESYQSTSIWGKLSNISDSSSSISLDARKENETQPNEPNEIDSSEGGKKSDGTKKIKVDAKNDEDNKTEKSSRKKDKKKRKRTEIEREESENDDDVKGKSRDKKKRKKKSKKN